MHTIEDQICPESEYGHVPYKPTGICVLCGMVKGIHYAISKEANNTGGEADE